MSRMPIRSAVLTAGALAMIGCQGRASVTPAVPVASSRDAKADAASARTAPAAARADVTLMLDWVPNTNHTGVYVAEERGFFADAGLTVEIIEPGEVMAQAAVASGAVDFGIDFQEQVTMARADARPLVSIAAIVQHNSSGFAARGGEGVKSPRDWAGLRYGSFASPFEEPTLRVLMACDGGDFSGLTTVSTGFADPLTLLTEGEIDLAWIFYGWQGIQAAQQGVALDTVMMSDHFACVPDYYTPILIASEATLAARPEIVRAFVGALARGYTFAADDPDAAAEILVRAVPELDRALVTASQRWLAPRYAADAARWGEQRRDVWRDYAQWMVDNGVIREMIDVDAAFTNAFLPGSEG